MNIIDKKTWLKTKSVFALSTGRVGTRTLYYSLKASRHINAYHEPHPRLIEEQKAARIEVYDKPETFDRFILDFIKNTPSGSFFELRAEDFFSNNFEVMESLCDFIGIPAIDRDTIASVSSQEYNKQKENAFPKFESWSREQRNILRNIAGETSEKLGYLI